MDITRIIIWIFYIYLSRVFYRFFYKEKFSNNGTQIFFFKWIILYFKKNNTLVTTFYKII